MPLQSDVLGCGSLDGQHSRDSLVDSLRRANRSAGTAGAGSGGFDASLRRRWFKNLRRRDIDDENPSAVGLEDSGVSIRSGIAPQAGVEEQSQILRSRRVRLTEHDVDGACDRGRASWLVTGAGINPRFPCGGPPALAVSLHDERPWPWVGVHRGGIGGMGKRTSGVNRGRAGWKLLQVSGTRCPSYRRAWAQPGPVACAFERQPANQPSRCGIQRHES